jgi:voltage-gated potassium channel
MKRKDQFTSFVVKYTDTLFEVMVLYSIIILIASTGFTYFEGLPFLKSLWLSFVTATSTGYGDISPKTLGGQITAVALMHATIFIVIPLAVARILSVVLQDRNAFTDEEQEEMKTILRQLAKKETP